MSRRGLGGNVIAQGNVMVVLFTDFGADDIYAGQMKSALHAAAPAIPVVDLLHSVPDFNVVAAAHLLAALRSSFQPGAKSVALACFLKSPRARRSGITTASA